jgi:glyoxylase-like metal-dependent hydrolase (beta-lactamase superfamily II)
MRGPVEIEPVASGVWRLEMEVAEAGLRSVCAYAVADGDGLVLIDAGWRSPQTDAGLERALESIGHSLADVSGVLLTHAHPDHYGLAGKLRERHGAWIALHSRDADLLAFGNGSFDRYVETWRDWLGEVGGVPAEDRVGLVEATVALRKVFTVPPPDIVFGDGWVAPLEELELRAVHTPGHSPGHVCFIAADGGLGFVGDHVLPDLTPNISAGPTVSDNPLGAYLASLARIRDLEGEVFLPGHGRPIEAAALAPRVGAIEAHHEQRLEAVTAMLAGGPATAWELTNRYPWARPMAEMGDLTRRSALCEITAHLQALEERGAVARETDGVVRWTVA